MVQNFAFAAHQSSPSRPLDRAEAVCRGHNARLTPIRRKVLEALYAADKPLGAYDLAEILAPNGRRLAPITVYRALDFLIEQGLAHRLASRNAYIASLNEGENRDMAAFLICENCGSVEEVTTPDLSRAIANLMSQNGFRAKSKVIEITGQCAHCQGGTH